jgi:hypothetical protein
VNEPLKPLMQVNLESPTFENFVLLIHTLRAIFKRSDIYDGTR